jgi:hypothetical protein
VPGRRRRGGGRGDRGRSCAVPRGRDQP